MADSAYSAFISYSHADEAWAKWLHRRLETYRVPSRLVGQLGAAGKVPARIGRCFRDQAELSASSHLGERLQQALRDSATLIVVCSPSAAKSHWVNEEVRYFRGLGRGQQIYALVVGGEPNAGNPALECFPLTLLRGDDGESLNEPLAADARSGHDGRSDAFLKLAAGLLGVGFDELRRREQRRRTQLMLMAIAASVAIATMTTVLAVAAYHARNEAERRRQQVEAREAELARVVAFQSAMLQRVDVQQLGSGWLEGMRRNIAANLEADTHLDPQQRAEKLLAFDDLRLRAQPSELARQSLGSFMLAPAAREIDQRFADDAHTQSALRLSLAEAYSALGLYADGAHEAGLASAIARKPPTDDEERALRADTVRARLLQALGRYDEALALSRSTLEAYRRRLGVTETEETLAVQQIITTALAGQSHFPQAEALLHPMLDQARQLGRGHERLVTRLQSDLGFMQNSLGHYADAEKTLHDSYLEQSQRFGDEDRDTMRTMVLLADALRNQSRLDEAAVYLERLLAVARKRYGDNHPEVLTYLINLANNLADRGQMEAAGKLEEQVLAAQVQQLGPDHPDTLRSMNNHAVTLQSLGQLDAALALRRQVLEARIRVLGPAHVSTLYARNNLGVTLRLAKDFNASLKELRQAYADHLRVLGPDHPRTAEVHMELAMTLVAMGRLDEGRQQGLAALADYARSNGPEAPITLSTTYDFLMALDQAGDHASARPLCLRALAVGSRVLPPDNLELLEQIRAAPPCHQA